MTTNDLKIYTAMPLATAFLVLWLTATATPAPASGDHQLDKIVEDGIACRREVAALESALRRAFIQLDHALDRIVDDDIIGERLSISALRRTVRLMRTQAAKVADAHRRMLDETDDYGERVREAAPLLDRAAREFKRFAQDEPYEDLREDYRRWGEAFAAIALKYQWQAEKAPAMAAVVRENLEYVQRTELQLARLERLLGILPEEGVATEEFLTRLSSYVESFQKLRYRLRKLHERTFANPASADQHARPTAAQQRSHGATAVLEPSRHDPLAPAVQASREVWLAAQTPSALTTARSATARFKVGSDSLPLAAAGQSRR